MDNYSDDFNFDLDEGDYTPFKYQDFHVEPETEERETETPVELGSQSTSVTPEFSEEDSVPKGPILTPSIIKKEKQGAEEDQNGSRETGLDDSFYNDATSEINETERFSTCESEELLDHLDDPEIMALMIANERQFQLEFEQMPNSDSDGEEFAAGLVELSEEPLDTTNRFKIFDQDHQADRSQGNSRHVTDVADEYSRPNSVGVRETVSGIEKYSNGAESPDALSMDANSGGADKIWQVQGHKRGRNVNRQEVKIVEDIKASTKLLIQRMTMTPATAHKSVDKFIDTNLQLGDEERLNTFVTEVLEAVIQTPMIATICIKMVKQVLDKLPKECAKLLRKIILNRTQKEFQCGISEESLQVLEFAFGSERGNEENVQMEAQRQLVRKKMVGIIHIIAELFKIQCLTLRCTIDVVKTLLESAELFELYYEYVGIFLAVCGQELEYACYQAEFKAVQEVIRGTATAPKAGDKDFMDKTFEKIKSVYETSKSPNVKFIMQGLLELREYGCWKQKAAKKALET